MNKLKGKKCYVTGSDGFIGKHLVKELKSYEADVTTLECDVIDEGKVLNEIRKHQPEIIYHLAAKLGKGKNEVCAILNTNVIGTLNILKSADKVNSVKSVVLMGSSDEYNTRSIYGITKKVVSELGILYSKNPRYSVVTLKPFIVYGPGQKNNAFVPSMMKAYISDRIFLMSKGLQKKDFVYIDDVIDSIILTSLTENISGKIIDIGTGEGTPIIELAEMMKKCGEFKYWTKAFMRSGELMEHVADKKKAKELLGWEAKVNIKEGLKKTLNWWKNENK